MLCILCVKFPDQIIDIFGEDGLRLNAGTVIVKHFWIQPKQSDENARFICCTCWNALDSFHKFYQQVEEAHINLVKANTTGEDDLKLELDQNHAATTEVEDVEKYDPCTDFLSADVKLEVKEDAEVFLPEYDPIPDIEDKVNVDLVAKSKQIHASGSGNSDDSESEIPLANLAKGHPKKRRKINADVSSNEDSDSSHEWQGHRSDADDDDDEDDDDESDFAVKKKTANRKSTTKLVKKRGRPRKNVAREFTPKQTSEEQIKKRELSQEYDEIIQQNMKLSCNVCQIPLANFFSLKKHYRSKHNERGYASCCGKKFLKRGILVDHIYIHLNPEHFKCDKCDKVLADRRCLEVHMNTHITEKQRIYQCDQCCKSFFKKPLLARHMHIHIPEEERKFPCEECNKFFPSNYTLRAHINNVHQNAYAKICDQCGKSIRGREAFQRHLLEHAGVPIPSVQCDKCGAKLKNKYGLKRHMNSMHAESNVPHVCNICGKVAPNSAALQRHYSYVHKCERNHKCPMCDKAFKKPGGLRPNETCENSRFICCTCWNAVNSFHKFYQQVEEAHISLSKTSTTEGAAFKQELNQISFIPKDSENVESYDQCTDFLCADVKLEVKEEAEIYLSQYDPLADKKDKESVESKTNPIQRLASDSDSSNDTDSETPLSKLATKRSSERTDLSNRKDSDASREDQDRDSTDDDDSNFEANKPALKRRANTKSGKKRGRPCKNAPRDSTPKQSTKEQIRKRILSQEHDEIILKNIKLTCNVCHIPLANFFALKKHYRSTHSQRGYALCCGKKFLKRCYLVDHINTHLNPEHFKCAKCDKVLGDRRGYDLHMKTHIIRDKRTFQCDQCFKTFDKQLLLSRHLQIHIPEEEREFHCDICNKLFPSKYLLNAHIKNVHENVYAKICDQCGKSIRGREAFRTHLLEHEGVPIPPVQCELCGVNLKNKYSLNRHMKSVHVESTGPHVCNICGKVVSSFSALKYHKSYVHRCQRNHKCTMCDKAFKRPGGLKEHMTTHTGEVLYTCPHCPKTFNSNANMHSHRKKMHRKEWEENRRHPHMGSAASPE